MARQVTAPSGSPSVGASIPTVRTPSMPTWKNPAEVMRKKKERERILTTNPEQLSPEDLAKREEMQSQPLPILPTTNPGGLRAVAEEQVADLKAIGAAKELETRRRPLRLQGRRSTRRSKITPDMFASSLTPQKTLLGD